MQKNILEFIILPEKASVFRFRWCAEITLSSILKNFFLKTLEQTQEMPYNSHIKT